MTKSTRIIQIGIPAQTEIQSSLDIISHTFPSICYHFSFLWIHVRIFTVSLFKCFQANIILTQNENAHRRKSFQHLGRHSLKAWKAVSILTSCIDSILIRSIFCATVSLAHQWKRFALKAMTLSPVVSAGKFHRIYEEAKTRNRDKGRE